MEKIAVVVPVLNEAENLRESVARILRAVASVHADPWIISVDDGSRDGSYPLMIELAAAEPRILPLAFTRNFGKEAAILAGLRAALADVNVRAVVVIDSDLQHPPEKISEFIAHWRSGALVVQGVRLNYQRPGFFRRVGTSIFYRFMARYAGLDLERESDFKLLDRTVVQSLLALGERARFFKGLVRWLGYSSVSVLFDVPERGHQKSRWQFYGLARYAWQSLTSFSSTPLQWIALMGGFGLALGVLLAFKAIADKMSGVAVDGFSTVILLLIIFSSLILLSLGIIGSYLARIYDEIKARPMYVLQDPSRAVSQRSGLDAQKKSDSSFPL